MDATERQLEVLQFISKYQGENCRPPALREIGRHFGFSVKAAFDHLQALKRKGYIKRGKGARAIMVVHKPVKACFYCAIEKEREDFFIATFPDVPNVNTFGKNRQHAIEMARNALEGCISLDMDRGFPIPESKYIGDPDCRIEVFV
jgi:predicted RNase H-like HicB family nuclease